MRTIGIRKEDKNVWERRVPLIPGHVKKLKSEFDITTLVEPFERRTFTDNEYKEAGAEVTPDYNDAPVIFAVKEIPIKLLQKDKTYIFFSHTIKGQDYNMPLLKKIMDLGCTLIDYETMTDENGRRVVFFGKYAGYAGMIDTLHGLGKRLNLSGIETPFLQIKPAYEYRDIEEAKQHVKQVSEEIKEKGLPTEVSPLVFGFAGYGNVYKGAAEVFDLLPFEEVTPEELSDMDEESGKIVKVVFKEKDMVKHKDGNPFELQDYYSNPENYVSAFSKYLDNIDVLINAIYWDDRYPVFVTKKYLKENKDNLKLKVIGDITCDIDGAIEITYKSTPSDNPAFVYNPATDKYTDGYAGKGVVNIAVDNLPAELPRDASTGFSNALNVFVPGIVNADMDKSFEDAGYDPVIKRAVIVYKGKLTPDYQYLEEYLD